MAINQPLKQRPFLYWDKGNNEGDRLTQNDRFFDEPGLPAVLKHGLLTSYLFPFTAMLGSIDRRKPVWFIDCYAGAGTSGSAQDISDGSPILAARVAAKSGVDLRCVFVEANRDYAQDLETALRQRVPAGASYRLFKEEAQTALPKILQLMGTDPALIFVDPFGLGISYDLFKATLGRPRPARTEILLNYNIEAIRRIGGHLSTPDRPGAEKSLQRVDASLGGTWWRSVFQENRQKDPEKSAARAADAVTSAFHQMVQQDTGRRAVTVPIRRSSTAREALFELTLFHDHEAAAYKFAFAASTANEKWRKADRERGRITDDRQAPLFSTAELSAADEARIEKQLSDEWTEEIAGNIERLLSTRSQLRLADELPSILGQTYGLARERHINAAKKLLQREGFHLTSQGSDWRTVLRRA